ncbi:MAG: hypothetical protein WBG19_07710 [Thermoplasmata archaeon]
MALPRSVRRWLLKDGDPSVRYRALRDLFDRGDADPELSSARREIGRTGWAAAILADQLPDGQWHTPGTTDRDLYVPKYIATNWCLLVLAELGVSGRDRRIQRAVHLFERRMGGPKGGFGGRGSELCFTGNAARMLSQFGYLEDPHLRDSLAWLVRRQKPDGGWHCWTSRTGTLDCWEALSAFAAVPPALRTPAIVRSIERGAEFYLSRGLLREGRRPYAPWFRLHFPVHYYYDLLVGLDVLTALGYGRDRRLRGPLDRLEAMRRPDGRWNVDAAHPDLGETTYSPRAPVYPFVLERPGEPSRWITTKALTVLRRAGRVS